MSRRKFLTDTAGIATDILAIVGILALLYGVWTAFESYVESMFETLEVNVRPICEPFPSPGVTYGNGQPAKVKLLGLDIKAEKDTGDAKFSMESIDYIFSWSIDTDAFSDEEAKTFLESLPKGNVQGKRIFGELPRILNGTETVLVMKAIPAGYFDCKDEWFNVSSEKSRVIQLNYLAPYTVRGWEWRGPSFQTIAFWAITVPLALYALYLRFQLRQREKRKLASNPSLKADGTDVPPP